jgi:hypothetical protein
VAVADEPPPLLLVLLLEELHPAATRTAVTVAAVSATKRVRLRVRRPAPPRPGPSLLGLTLVPSTTSLPMRFDQAAPVPSRQDEKYTGRSVKINGELPPCRIACRGFCVFQPQANMASASADAAFTWRDWEM